METVSSTANKHKRMEVLRAAASRFGRLSLEQTTALYAIGNDIVDRFGVFLGDRSWVSGVPPVGDSDHDTQYRDEKFSSFDEQTLRIGQISMGLSIAIPFDDHHFKRVVVIDLEFENGEVTIGIGDGPRLEGISPESTERDADRINETIYDYVLSMFTEPMRLAEASASGRIGFRP